MLYLELTIFIVICAFTIIFASDIGERLKNAWDKPVTRHCTAQLILCFAIVPARGYLIHGVNYLLRVYHAFVVFVLGFIGHGQVDQYMARVFSLWALIILVTALPALMYWLFKAKRLPRLYTYWWCMFVLLSSLIVLLT